MKNKLTFTMEETSKGYLIQGMEIPEIIVEVTTKEEIVACVNSAIHCYFESFPEQRDIVFKDQKSPIIESKIIENKIEPKINKSIIKIPVRV